MANEVYAPSADSWTHTRSNITKLNHKWTISNFSFHSRKLPSIPSKEFLQSSEFSYFSSADNDNLKWQLKLYPSSETNENRDWIALYLQRLASRTPAVEVTAKLHLVDANNVMKHSSTLTKSKFFPNDIWGYPKYIEKKILLKDAKVLLPDDSLTIFCEIDILENIVEVSGKREPIHLETTNSQITDDFGLLFKTHDFSDVTLTVDGKDISAHKILLIARSPVFSAMFKNNMKETKLSRVVIDDMDYEVFMEMLHFFYTDKVASLEKMAPKLLAAADRYNVEGLKAMCARALRKNLNIENAVEILILADLHNADRLKISVIDFIRNFSKDIIDTGAFESLADSYPDLMVETLRAMRTRKNSSNSITNDVKSS